MMKSCSTTKAVFLICMMNLLMALAVISLCSQSRQAEGSSIRQTLAGFPRATTSATLQSSPPESFCTSFSNRISTIIGLYGKQEKVILENLLFEDNVALPYWSDFLEEQVLDPALEFRLDGLRFETDLQLWHFLGKLGVSTCQNLDKGSFSGSVFSQKDNNF